MPLLPRYRERRPVDAAGRAHEPVEGRTCGDCGEWAPAAKWRGSYRAKRGVECPHCGSDVPGRREVRWRPVPTA